MARRQRVGGPALLASDSGRNSRRTPVAQRQRERADAASGCRSQRDRCVAAVGLLRRRSGDSRYLRCLARLGMARLRSHDRRKWLLHLRWSRRRHDRRSAWALVLPGSRRRTCEPGRAASEHRPAFWRDRFPRSTVTRPAGNGRHGATFALDRPRAGPNRATRRWSIGSIRRRRGWRAIDGRRRNATGGSERDHGRHRFSVRFDAAARAHRAWHQRPARRWSVCANGRCCMGRRNRGRGGRRNFVGQSIPCVCLAGARCRGRGARLQRASRPLAEHVIYPDAGHGARSLRELGRQCVRATFRHVRVDFR